MSQNIDREGIFLAQPIEWSINPSKSSEAVALNVQYRVLGQFDGENLVGWEDADVVVYGYHYWVGKTGNLAADSVERLIRSGLWDGKLSSIHGQLPPDIQVKITVENQPYNGRDQYRVAWVNHKDDVTGTGFKQVEESEVKQLEARFGSLLRATVASLKAGFPPSTESAAPPPAKAAPPSPKAEAAVGDGDNLPF